ncbi:hypothetical protein ACFQZC_36845 [Streptacidiphilus monticola]
MDDSDPVWRAARDRARGQGGGACTNRPPTTPGSPATTNCATRCARSTSTRPGYAVSTW